MREDPLRPGRDRFRRGLLLGGLLLGISAAATAAAAAEEPDATGEPGKTGASGEAAYAPPAPITGCEPSGRTEPICGFENPEDLVALPGDRALLVSEYGDLAHARPGSIALLRIASREREVLYRGEERGEDRGEAAARGGSDAASAPAWGSPDCPGPPGASFSPHGIDLVRLEDGRLQLLAVQHGGRESIELFEVTGEGERWQVEWRGCVLSPEDASLNDIVGLADGRFYTTKMATVSGAADLLSGFPETDTGHLFGWSASRGYWVVPGTSGKMPNGVEATPDGRIVYMNASGGNELRKVEASTGQVLGRAAVLSPDNVTWSPDGQSLLVASLGALDLRDFALCQDLPPGTACPIPFQIVEVDADTMSTRVVFDSVGTPMGAGTVGLRVGDDLFIGSFAGDRVLRVDLR